MTQLDWIDTHTHLFVPEFDTDREQVVRRAMHEGVKAMMLPNIDWESIGAVDQLAEQFPLHVFPMMGLHPCSVKENYRDILNQMQLKLEEGKYVGIGETGIDLYWDSTFKKEQIDAFEQHIHWGLQYALPVIIHSRESLDLNIEIIAGRQNGDLKGIFHCFTGTYDQAMKIAGLGFKIGIGGVLTYKKSDLPSVLGRVPPEILVLETDSPYLTPVPFRGKRNESSYLPLIGKRLSEALGWPLEKVAQVTTENANEVFGKKR